MDLNKVMAIDGDPKKVVVLSPRQARTAAMLLGSSVPTSIRRGQYHQGGIPFNLSGYEGLGVLAVVVNCDDMEHGKLVVRVYPLLLAISQDGIIMDKAFVPEADRLADIVFIGGGQYALRVHYQPNPNFSAVIYTTQPDVPGTSYVKDDDLLCRFLVGKATEQEVHNACMAVAAEATVQQQLEEICHGLEYNSGLARFVQPDQVVKAVQERIEHDGFNIAHLKQELEAAVKAAESHRHMCEILAKRQIAWRTAATTLVDAITGPFCGRRARIAAALKQVDSERLIDTEG